MFGDYFYNQTLRKMTIAFIRYLIIYKLKEKIQMVM